MKRWFTLWVVLFIVLSAMAVPAKPGVWRTISLTDGTQVKVQLVGDEFMHYYQSADGTRYIYDAASATYQVYSDSQFSNSRRKAVARRAKANNRRAVRRKANVTNIFQGTKKGLIILAQFTDSKFQSGHDRALYNKIANAENYTDNGFKGSVKDYFKAQSAGQFELDFDVVGICPLKNPCSYYGGNDASIGEDGVDLRAGEMVAEACQWAATQGVDFSKYDWDGDGEVDQVFVLYAGKGEADGGAASTVWPHEYALSYSDYGKSLSFNGVKVDTYACSAELNGRGKLDGIGTFCHEFSHCMGFPDLYDTGYSGWFGMGDYDLMCAGNYNGDGKCPAGYSAYEKHECGWLTYQDVTNIEDDLNVTGLKAISEGGSAYVVKNKAHEDEYYIIENRQNTGWDAYLPSEGVMITHVDYDANIWWNNMPNTKGNYYDEHENVYYNDHQRLTIFRAGRSTSDYGATSDLYPYNTNNSLTAESNPAATLYNKNSDGTKYMHVDITDISVASDGTASLTFSKADRSSGGTDPDTPVTPSGSVLLYESFDKCDGTGGNDNQWSGNGVAGSEALSMEFDNNGWTSSNKIFSGNQCVRLGNSSTAGIITTPAFSVNGSAYLSFKAGGWDGTDDAKSLTLSVNNGTLSKTSVRISKGSWNQFGVTITATGTVKVTFKADKQRFFLDEVKVVDPTIDSGIHDIVAGEENGIVAYYSLNGSRLNGPRPGVCIVRYANGEVRKVVIR